MDFINQLISSGEETVHNFTLCVASVYIIILKRPQRIHMLQCCTTNFIIIGSYDPMNFNK